MNIFDRASVLIDSIEFSFTTFISKVVPWLVPIIPAYVTGHHISITLELGNLFGIIGGVIVEGLGFASTHRLFLFIENNKKYSSEKNQMPVWLPVVSFLWYLIVVLFVNVLLEIDSGASIVRVVAIGALTTLSIPTMAIIASTAIMTERKLERASKITSKTSKSFGTSESTKIGRPSQHRDTVFAYMDTIYNSEQRVATFKELKDHTGLSEATVSRLRNLWISEKGLSK